ncbi:MAG: T9SS type A sorting domain-containing protein [Saprospiraceae bacterium]
MRRQYWFLLSLFSLVLLTEANAQIKVVNEGILTIKDDQLVHINGSFSNFSALLLNNGDFRLTGDFLNEVNVPNQGIGIYRFIGFDQQNLTLYDTLRMFNVEIDNPAGVNFDGTNHLEIFGNFNFFNGIAYTNENSMSSFRNNASTSGANDFSHINGPALKTGIEDFTFPIGKEDFYKPASISDLAESGTFQMEYFREDYFTEIKNFDVLKVNEEGYWDVKNINSIEFPKLTLNYDELSNLFSNNDDLTIVHWKEQWENVASQSDGASPSIGLTTQERLAEFGFFTTAERIYFNQSLETINIAQDEDCNIRLDWAMAEGTLVQSYEIEYSYDSLEFFYIGEVAGYLEPLPGYRTFFFIDESLHSAEKIYYRIKMVPPGIPDYYTYSNTVSIDNKCVFGDCVLYPNPVSANENIKFRISSDVAVDMPLEIWDELGRLMFKQTLELQVGPHVYEIQTAERRLASATYFLKISPRKSLKFVVINSD